MNHQTNTDRQETGKMNAKFEVNGKWYATSQETLALLKKLNDEGNDNAASMIFNCGLFTGSIVAI